MRFLLLIVTVALAACAHQPVVEQCPDYNLSFDPIAQNTPIEPDEASDWVYVPGWSMPGAGGAIKTWDTTSKITANDLNANFQHIHNNMVGGHGARLIDADVNASANIASSKLAAYRLIPVAWAGSPTTCAVATCTIVSSSRVTSITRSGAGSYRVNISPVLTDLNFSMAVSGNTGASGRICYYISAGSTTAQLIFVCSNDFVGTLVDASFSLVIYDDN